MAGGNHGGGCLIGLIFVAAVIVMLILNGIIAF